MNAREEHYTYKVQGGNTAGFVWGELIWLPTPVIRQTLPAPNHEVARIASSKGLVRTTGRQGQ